MRKIYFRSLMCSFVLFLAQGVFTPSFAQIAPTSQQQLEAERALMEQSNFSLNLNSTLSTMGVMEGECDNALPITSGSITDQPLVCGTEDLLNSTTAGPFCTDQNGGDTINDSYGSGLEATYTYTPSEDGTATITVSNTTWTAIFVYEGCPTTGTCVAATRSTGSTRTLTFEATEGVEYFIWVDSWPSPDSPCVGGGLLSFSGPEPMGDAEPEGCLDGTLYPAATYSPNCSGTPQVITSIAYAGEYTNINVINGNTYTFDVTNGTDFITIANEAGDTVIASGVGSVTWESNFNGVVRFYNHLNADCETQSSSRTKRVNCVQPPPIPCTTTTITSYPFTETFENDSETRQCWENEYVNGTLDWTYRAGAGGGGAITSAHNGAYNASFYQAANNGVVTKLVSPVFDFSAIENATLNFWYANQEWLGDQNELRVYYKTSADGDWTLIPDAEYTTSVTTWTEVTLDLPESDGVDTYYIAFEGFNDFARGVVVDDVVVDGDEVTGPDGCLTGTLYPSTTFTPACYGSPQEITAFGWAGEYSNVNVVAGTEYIFSSSIDTDFITIANTDGTSVYASGTGSVTWTATANEVVRFYTHADADCTSQNVSRSRIVQCGSPIEFEDPAFDCFFGDGGLSGLENGYGVNPTDVYRVADDFTIEAETTFTVQQIILNVLTASDISSATINIREDNAGTPGDVVETVTMAPTSFTVFGTAFTFNAHRLVFDLAETFELTEGTYWLEPTFSNTGGTTVYWEVTSLGSTGAPLQASNTSGTSWVPDDSGFDYNAVFYIAGECEAVTEEEGCLDAPSGQYPSTTFVPSCIGVVESITTAAWTGEYSLVQVTAGVEYTFSSSITTDFVTIADENGTVSYAAGTGSVTWTATADEVVRFYLHLDDECNSINSGLRSRLVQCGEVPPAPANDDCEDAIALACGESDSGTTFGANNSGGGAGADVFYSFTGDGTEQLVTVSLCGSSFDTYLRIFSDCTLTNEIAFNDDSCGLQSELTFLSDGTSTYIILVEGWSTNVGDYTINITCEDAPEAPENCEDFVVPSNNLENGLFFGGDTAQHLAADIPVGENGFTIYGVTPTVVDYATTFEFTFYEDAGGLPGAVFAERTGTIFGSEVTGNNFGYDFVKYQVTFEALTFEPNTRYWMEIESDAMAWESNSAQFMPLGTSDVFYNTNVGEGVWTSTGGDEFVFELICEELGVSDMTSFDFAYYPNPVKDVLNINAKKGVESVSAFNLAGQQVIKDAKVSNGQIDVNSLTPGTYVFRVTLEGGQVETFKIIKK